MAIVPSGNRRLMKLQQNYEVTDSDSDAMQSEVKSGKSGQEAGPSFDWNAVQQGTKNQSVTGPQYGEEDFKAAVEPKVDSSVTDPNEVEQNVQDLGRKGANIRGHIFQLLEELGAPPRLLMESPDTFFQGKKDLDTGVITGSYILPSYTKNKKITQQEAEGVAMQIGNMFGLSQSISPMGNNFKVDFRTREVEQGIDHGTSLQELVKGKGGMGGSPGGISNRKAAQTQGEMIKASRQNLYDAVKRLGFGDKNG